MTKVKKVYSGKRQFLNAATFSSGVASDNPMKSYNERNYMWVAKKILKLQKKLGAIKSMNVKVESLSESRKDRLKQTGVLLGAYLGSAAIMAGVSGVTKAKLLSNGERPEHVKGKPFTNLANKGKATFSKDNINNFKSGALQSAKVSAATTAAASGLSALKNQVADRNKRNVVIHVKYKYGERMFVVFQLKEKYENKGIENLIFNNVKNNIAKLKSRDTFPAREDVQSLTEQKTLILESMLIDTVLGE